MEKEFAPYELALKMKALGFDEPCFGFYSAIYYLIVSQTNGKKSLFDAECLAPTFSQCFRWFRDNHKLYVNIESQKNEMGFWGYVTNSTDYLHDVEVKIYEEAELACLEKLISIVESQSE